jgi:hypothetical protein
MRKPPFSLGRDSILLHTASNQREGWEFNPVKRKIKNVSIRVQVELCVELVPASDAPPFLMWHAPKCTQVRSINVSFACKRPIVSDEFCPPSFAQNVSFLLRSRSDGPLRLPTIAAIWFILNGIQAVCKWLLTCAYSVRRIARCGDS